MSDPQSAVGISGIRYSHLSAALCDELVEDACHSKQYSASNILNIVYKCYPVRVEANDRAGRVG